MPLIDGPSASYLAHLVLPWPGATSQPRCAMEARQRYIQQSQSLILSPFGERSGPEEHNMHYFGSEVCAHLESCTSSKAKIHYGQSCASPWTWLEYRRRQGVNKLAARRTHR